MRISDWSSDVCSSDLRATPGSRRGPQHEAGGDLAGGDHSPEGHQQLAGERHDQLLAQRLARVDDAFGAAPVPAGEFAGGLEEQEPHGELVNRTDEGRVGKEWVWTCRSWWSVWD